MQATLTRPLDWRWPLILVGLVAVNLVTLAVNDPGLWTVQDWGLFQHVPALLSEGRLYDTNFVWSPLAAYLLIPFVHLGYGVWFALHAVALLALPTRVALLVLASLPFWADTILGNSTVWVVVAGYTALSGSRTGSVAYLTLCALMPRPLQLPLALWLLWRDRWLIWPALALGVVTVVFSAWAGLLDDWVLRLLPFGGENTDAPANLSPTQWFGAWWYVIGLPLAVWLAARGRVGFAALAVSPYVWPQYLLVLLWEVQPAARRNAGTT